MFFFIYPEYKVRKYLENEILNANRKTWSKRWHFKGLFNQVVNRGLNDEHQYDDNKDVL